ncbi:MAG: hypothetical protein WBR24_06740 [Desulfobacterales bacterium]|jgi:hypothetical protein
MEEIVDIGSTEFRRGNLKRLLLRIVVPIACVALTMASILGIALYSYSNNRRDALALSEDVLASLDRRLHLFHRPETGYYRCKSFPQ